MSKTSRAAHDPGEVLLREWASLDDEPAARVLYDIVADRPLSWRATMVLAVLGSAWFGILGSIGYCVSVLGSGYPAADLPQLAIALGSGLLGGFVVLLSMRLVASRFWAWRRLLAALAVSRASLEYRQTGPWFLMAETLVCAVVTQLFVYLAVSLLLGMLAGGAVPAVACAAAVLATYLYLLTALSRSLILWLLHSTACFLLSSGCLGLLFLLEVNPFLLPHVPWIYCTGLAVCVLGTSTCVGGDVSHGQLFEHRQAWFWWRRRQEPGQVPHALRQINSVASRHMLGQIESYCDAAVPTRDLVCGVDSPGPQQRLAARYGLILGGGGRICEWLALVDGMPCDTAWWILQGIEIDTTCRLKHRAHRLRCRDHLVTVVERRIDCAERSFHYWGCRYCGQSGEEKHWDAKPVVAVVDRDMNHAIQNGKDLRVNWLDWQDRGPFDFDRIEVGPAESRDVLGLMEQIGNDMDPYRRRRYGSVSCLIRADARLPENVVRSAQSMLGRVDREHRP